MTCRQCGTEIADKAIVCYRCGTATTEPTFRASAVPRSRSAISLVTSVLAIVLLALSALYMQRFVTVGAPSALRWLIVVLAVALVALDENRNHAEAIGLGVFSGQYRNDTGQRSGLSGVDVLELCVCMRGTQNVGVGNIGRHEIVGVAARTTQQPRVLDARHTLPKTKLPHA